MACKYMEKDLILLIVKERQMMRGHVGVEDNCSVVSKSYNCFTHSAVGSRLEKTGKYLFIVKND